jgi:hypothetical protein
VRTHSYRAHTVQKSEFFNQSQRCISSCIINHGVSLHGTAVRMAVVDHSHITPCCLMLPWYDPTHCQVKPRLRVTSNAEELWPKSNWQSFDFGRSKQLFHTSQTGPPFCTFYWLATFSSAKRVSSWPRGRNLGGVTGELRRLGLTIRPIDELTMSRSNPRLGRCLAGPTLYTYEDRRLRNEG